MALVGLALSASGGGKKEAKTRPLPEDQKALYADECRSEESEPSLSFRVGKGWTSAPPESSKYLRLQRGAMGGMLFLRVKEVYGPARGRNPIMTTQGNEDTVGLYEEVVTAENLDLADEQLTRGCVAHLSVAGQPHAAL